MTKVLYHIMNAQPTNYLVKFWIEGSAAKPIVETFVTLDEEKLKVRFAHVFHLKEVRVERVK